MRLVPMVIIGLIATILAGTAILWLGINEPTRMQRFDDRFNGRQLENGGAIFVTNCAPCHGIDGKGNPGRAPGLNSAHFFTQRLSEIGFAGTITDYVRLTIAGGRPVKTSTQWAQPMPTWGQSFGGPLRDDQVADVAAFVLNWRATATDQGAVIPPAPGGGQVATGPTPTPQAGFVGTDLKNPPLPQGNADRGKKLFDGTELAKDGQPLGCNACHSTTANVTILGPSLFGVWDRAAERIKAPDYHGKATNQEEYIRESEVNPSVYVVPGFQDAMLKTFGQRETPQDLADIIAYLQTLK